MTLCARYLYVETDEAGGFSSRNLRPCGRIALWQFNYKYQEEPCSCGNKYCAAHFESREGSTPLCEECKDESLRQGRLQGNLVPEDQQFTRLKVDGQLQNEFIEHLRRVVLAWEDLGGAAEVCLRDHDDSDERWAADKDCAAKHEFNNFVNTWTDRLK